MWDKVRKAARKAEEIIQKRIDSVFPQDPASLLELRQQILEKVEDQIEFDRGGASFWYDRVSITFPFGQEDQRDILNRAFVEERPIKDDILTLLRTHQCRMTAEPMVIVKFSSEEPAADAPPFRIEFSTKRTPSGDKAERQAQPQAMLTVLKGSADPVAYTISKKRTRIGRLSELFDEDGALARRNDVAFADEDDQVNSTVGRAHATIAFDSESREFRVVDENSRFGTRIFRDDRTINVPPGGRGIALKTGDEIYLGRACVRFEIGGNA